jgi:hypothetical protein
MDLFTPAHYIARPNFVPTADEFILARYATACNQYKRGRGIQSGIFKQSMGGLEPSRNRVVVPTRAPVQEV